MTGRSRGSWPLGTPRAWRAEALKVRVERASAALERARDALAQAERAAQRERVAQLDAQLRELDARITGEVRDFYERLLGRIREARKLAAEANTIGPVAEPARGSRWAAASPTRRAWIWAQGALPQDVGGVS
jgi:hypothetical protein